MHILRSMLLGSYIYIFLSQYAAAFHRAHRLSQFALLCCFVFAPVFLFLFPEEMAKWKKMTAGMAVLSVAVTALVLATEEHHEPHDDGEPVVSLDFTYAREAFVTGLD